MSADATAPQLGREVVGPSALGANRHRVWILARTLSVTDFKLKFFGSVLGYLWQIMRPLLLFGVLFTVFTEVVNLGKDVPLYATALLLAIVLYGFFNESTSAAVKSLVDREHLVRKIDFPRLAIPLATVMTSLMNLGLNLLAVFVFLFVEGGSVRWTWLELPFLVAALALLSLGLSMLLSASFVRYRDVAPIWDVVLQALFYASPIFYPVQTIHGSHAELIRKLLMCNPFAAIMQQARHALLGSGHPSAAAAMGGRVWLLIPAGIVVFVSVVGWRVFNRAAPEVAELL